MNAVKIYELGSAAVETNIVFNFQNVIIYGILKLQKSVANWKLS